MLTLLSQQLYISKGGAWIAPNKNTLQIPALVQEIAQPQVTVVPPSSGQATPDTRPNQPVNIVTQFGLAQTKSITLKAAQPNPITDSAKIAAILSKLNTAVLPVQGSDAAPEPGDVVIVIFSQADGTSAGFTYNRRAATFATSDSLRYPVPADLSTLLGLQ